MKYNKQQFDNTQGVEISNGLRQETASPISYTSESVLPDVWRCHLETIYKFLDRRPHYEQLCKEVAYIIQQRMEAENIEVSSITYRAKELNSFMEKLERKQCVDPFRDITDFAGVRIVCLYPSDVQVIETLLEREFDLIEKIDKRDHSNSDRFGYSAVHFLAKLGKDFSGARYDNLKDLICEIQIRTILQHAWALIDQHLVYKKQSSVPPELRCQINELSKVLENADKQFELIRQQRIEYIKTLEETKSKDAFLNLEINLDSLKVFCERSFPHHPDEEDNRNFSAVLKWIEIRGYRTISQIHEKVQQAAPRLDRVMEEMKRILIQRGRQVNAGSNLFLVHISIVAVDPEYRVVAGISREFTEMLEKLDKTYGESAKEPPINIISTENSTI